ncbi:MAG: xanthine dehydrogenase family protein molybdopterin-binding subunit [Dehalococcoidia bacterium]
MTLRERPDQGYAVVGTTPARHDGHDKVTGRALYGADVSLPGLVWGEVLRSPHAHAVIRSVDTSAAEAMPGVLAVVAGPDLPMEGRVENDLRGGVMGFEGMSANILASDKVLYRGHAVAAVAAVDRNTAQEAVKRIAVEYEPLPPVLDLDEAVAEGAPILLDNLTGYHMGRQVTGTNVARQFRIETGDPDAGFEGSSLVLERTFSVGMAHQGYIEPHTATAIWGEDDRITIWSSTQGVFGVRDLTAGFLGIDPSRIRVMPVENGGGFGGKTIVYLPPIAALLSRGAGRPVRIVMDRRTVFEASGPVGASKISVKMGVDDSGMIRAAEAVMKYEAGAYPGSWVDIGARSVFSCYDVPAVRIDGYDIVVNKPRAAAYRAPGVPQATFATESVMDEICALRGWDPIAFRLKNASREGTRRSDGSVFPRIGFEETLRAARDSAHWNTPLAREGEGGRVRGRGIASAYCGNSGGRSSVSLSLSPDGSVALVEGSADLSGSRATVAMQVAEVLGLAAEDVRPVLADTGSIGYTDITGGSRTTHATGMAACRAAEAMVETLRGRAALIWGINEGDVEFTAGEFRSRTDPELRLGFKDLAGRLDGTGGPAVASASVDLVDGGGGVFGTHIADVEIDPETGKTDVVRYTVIQDAGRAIHPQHVEGQMQGGAAQGIGWALNEEYVLGPDGAMANPTFLDYRMPTSCDLPMIETVIVEVPNPAHPYGVRGIGEIPIGPPLATIGNAIRDALGVRLTEAPMNPPRILAALAEKRRSDES